MKNDWTAYMKSTKRLKLTLAQYLTHYGIVLFLLFISALCGWSLIERYVTHTYTGVLKTEEVIRTSLPFFLLAVLYTFIQYRRLKFTLINLTYTGDQFQQAVERTVKDLEWRIETSSKTLLRAYRPSNWSGSWGEMITIIKDKDSILINSICNPDSISSVASYGWNKKNVQTFIKNLTDVLNNKSAEIKTEKVTNEWSAKSILLRIFFYPFCLFLIVLGVYMILHFQTIRSLVAGSGVITLAIVYLYSDIKILRTKNENDKRQDQ